jgi:hypothetical protein
LSLTLRPIILRDAQAFITGNHRHNRPPRGWKFGTSVWKAGVLVGVATAGRPVARLLDNGVTVEVNRTCTDGTRNANSMLYGAIWRAAKALGYLRCITYTQGDEDGASLRAVGFMRVAEIEAAPGWDRPGRQRAEIGSGGVKRQRWEITAEAFRDAALPTT